MNGLHHPLFYAILMLVAGLGIPIFAALNGELGTKFQSPALAATISLLVAIVASLCFLFITEGTPKLAPVSPVPIYYYLGGLFVVLYILGMTWVAPKFGVGNAVAFVLLGQLISMAIIDHFGLLGALHHPISIQRFAGLIFMGIGVFLAVRR
ncbi:MAG: EamA-like transporter family protein [Gammaproteobacteria bacterium]|nr:MAG: EamA-like transporter family protein [Gammaproteobacteria bacterium]